MARNITVIPARANRINLAEEVQPQKKKMAAYCRVSTDQLQDLSSYEAQVNYYTTFINNSSEYEMEGILQTRVFQEPTQKSVRSLIK